MAHMPQHTPEQFIQSVCQELDLNNKNWSTQVESVFNDLYPARLLKRSLQPTIPRVAIVGLIGKAYESGGRYPGVRKDLNQWEREVHTALKGVGTRRAKALWHGRRLTLQHEWLDSSVANFFQLHAFIPA